MCGRFTKHLTHEERALLDDLDWSEIKLVFKGFDAFVKKNPRYNIAPMQQASMLRLRNGAPEIVSARWSLLPSWAKEPKLKFSTFNARSETAAEKPVFRSAFKRRRCVIPIDGFYEWTGPKGDRTPHHIFRTDGDELYMAGLWELWEHDDHEPILSFTVLTCPANTFMANLHKRMPVILEPHEIQSWLDPDNTNKEALKAFLDPCPERTLSAHMVSRYVSNSRNEGSKCLE